MPNGKIKSLMNCNKPWLCLISFLPIFLFPSHTLPAQTNIDHLEISLLTCENGNALYSTFGHSALRIIDKKNEKDIVFDYGNFDFGTRFFAFQFLRGSLDYHLGVANFTNFQKAYQRTKRSVTEQSLNLPMEAKKAIYQALLTNYQPENRYYKYDFLKDNCATRIRDIIDKLDVEKVDSITTKTYRNQLKTYLTTKPWLVLGIDILLGAPADKQITASELMFLPNSLKEQLNKYKIDGRNLLNPLKIIVPSKKVSAPQLFIFHPLFYTSFLLLLAIFLFFKAPIFLSKIANLLFISLGLSGLLLLFLWFGTKHDATQMNYNLLWLNPFYLILPFLKNNSLKKGFLKTVILINSLLLLFWFVIPQVFNLALVSVVGTIILLNLASIKN